MDNNEKWTREALLQLIEDAETHYRDGMITAAERNETIRRLQARIEKLEPRSETFKHNGNFYTVERTIGGRWGVLVNASMQYRDQMDYRNDLMEAIKTGRYE